MKKRAGFTLIEILVVVAIVATVAGAIGLSFSGTEARSVRREADQLALLIRSAREQAVLENRLFVVLFTRTGYRFMTPDEKGVLSPVADDVLRDRRLASGVEIDGVNVEGRSLAEDPRIVLSPTGEATPAEVFFLKDGVRNAVRVQTDGTVITEAAHA